MSPVDSLVNRFPACQNHSLSLPLTNSTRVSTISNTSENVIPDFQKFVVAVPAQSYHCSTLPMSNGNATGHCRWLKSWPNENIAASTVQTIESRVVGISPYDRSINQNG